MNGPRLVKEAVIQASDKLKAAMEPRPARLSLYDLTDQLTAIDELLEEAGGELTEELEARLEALRGSFDDKVDNICILRQQRIRAAEAVDAEIERLKKRKASAERGAESLRTYLLAGFIRAGVDKVKTARFTVWRQNSPLSLRWSRELVDLPAEFCRVRVEPDIAKAKEVLKAGGELPEGFVTEQNQHIRIS